MLSVFVQLGLKMNLRGHNRQLRWVLVACNQPGLRPCAEALHSPHVRELRYHRSHGAYFARRKITRKLSEAWSIPARYSRRCAIIKPIDRTICLLAPFNAVIIRDVVVARKQTLGHHCPRQKVSFLWKENKREWEKLHFELATPCIPGRIQGRWRRDDYAELYESQD